MAMTLVRADQARGLVRACLLMGKLQEAEAICTMYYAAHPHAPCAEAPSRGGADGDAARFERAGGGYSSMVSSLRRFARDFGLDLATEKA